MCVVRQKFQNRGKFYGCPGEVLRNSQGIYKIRIKDEYGWRYVLDSDVMTIISGSHVSKHQMFLNTSEVNRFVKEQVLCNPAMIKLQDDREAHLLNDFEPVAKL